MLHHLYYFVCIVFISATLTDTCAVTVTVATASVRAKTFKPSWKLKPYRELSGILYPFPPFIGSTLSLGST